MKGTFERTGYACFLTSFSTAVASNLPPLLFVAFHGLYGISYSLIGLLVVLNFGTQLLCDLVFSFFSHRIPLKSAVRAMPAVMFLGLLVFAGAPVLSPGAPYFLLALGTVIYSAGSGLAEVLVSPVIAAIPAKDPDRRMSRLHSCYAWGLLVTVSVSALYFSLVGIERWPLLCLILSALPFLAAMMLFTSPIPDMETPEHASGAAALCLDRAVVPYLFCIFLGGAAECTMSQWCSGYLETALGISKAVGDLLGVALFGGMLGLGRSLYGKYGKNIHTVLFACALGTSVCYLCAVLSPVPALGLVACALTGLCVSMLWPGSLIAVTDRAPHGGVALFALMAAGGDLGAALVPQAVGLITDTVLSSERAAGIAASLSMSPDAFGMKCAMAFASLFPIAAAILYGVLLAKRKKAKEQTASDF